MSWSISKFMEDPIGLAEEPSVADRLRSELKILRAGVRRVVESTQGLQAVRAEDSKSLVACLDECMREQREDMDHLQREVQNLRQTVAMLQEERRRSCCAPAQCRPNAQTTQSPGSSETSLRSANSDTNTLGAGLNVEVNRSNCKPSFAKIEAEAAAAAADGENAAATDAAAAAPAAAAAAPRRWRG